MPAIRQHLHLTADTPRGKRLHNPFERMRVVPTVDHMHRTNDLPQFPRQKPPGATVGRLPPYGSIGIAPESPGRDPFRRQKTNIVGAFQESFYLSYFFFRSPASQSFEQTGKTGPFPGG